MAVSRQFWLIGIGILLAACQEEVVSEKSNMEAVTILSVGHQTEELCPRIIQKRIDTTKIIRSDSLMGKNCEYFVYPYVGDYIDVHLSNRKIKTTLESPYLHDFANGAYLVRTQGRHIIRLSYDAFGRKPDVLNYDIVVDIKPDTTQ